MDVDDAPIIKLVESLLTSAVEMRVSDIHLEPKETKLQVRFRVDGILQKMVKDMSFF